MPLLRCHADLYEQVDVPPTRRTNQTAVLGDWYAAQYRLERRKCVLVINEKTALTFFMPGLLKKDLVSLADTFRQHVFRVLFEAGIDNRLTENLLENLDGLNYSKRLTRLAVRQLDETFAFIDDQVSEAGGLERLDLVTLHIDLNQIIMRRIDFRNPFEALADELSVGLT